MQVMTGMESIHGRQNIIYFMPIKFINAAMILIILMVSMLIIRIIAISQTILVLLPIMKLC